MDSVGNIDFQQYKDFFCLRNFFCRYSITIWFKQKHRIDSLSSLSSIKQKQFKGKLFPYLFDPMNFQHTRIWIIKCCYRLATMLRALALYHGKSPVHLFMVRLAQGLCHAGKGTVTLCPTHADRRLINQPALAGLLVVLTAFLDCKNSKFVSSLNLFKIVYSIMTQTDI